MRRQSMRHRERGMTLILLLVVLGLAGVLLAAKLAEGMSVEDQAQQELVAMGQIRDALIARAAGDKNRPGSLPCPDVDNDGMADGSSCAFPFVGRLPWKTLDLPEPLDSAAEPFWYAISAPYRDHSFAGTLNSDTAGTITVNGSPTVTDVVAVIIAPRGPLPGQTRDMSNPSTLLDRTNYLEGENAASPLGADVLFERQSTSDGFNDLVFPITRAMLMPAVERRVVRQARRCLIDSAKPLAPGLGHYPYAAVMSDTTNYQEVSGQLFGRIPKTLLGGAAWPPDSVESTDTCFGALWWNYWRELLLYRVGSPFTAAPSGTCPSACLFINGTGSVEAVVIVAGKALNPNPINQTFRLSITTYKQLPNYYLEPAAGIDNAMGLASSRTFVRSAAAADFDDRVECIGPSPVCD